MSPVSVLNRDHDLFLFLGNSVGDRLDSALMDYFLGFRRIKHMLQMTGFVLNNNNTGKMFSSICTRPDVDILDPILSLCHKLILYVKLFFRGRP